MIFSHKKVVIFELKPLGTMNFKRFKFILSIGLALTSCITFSQEKDKALQKSNDLVYEGNEIVSEDFIGAEKEYRKAISKLPTNAPGNYNLGNALYDSGYYEEALVKHIEASKNAVTKQEKHKAYHNIGNAMMQQRMCKEAVEAFKNALRNEPSDDESRYNLALAKECAKEQGQGEGDDENKDEENKDDKKDQDENSENQEDKGDNEQDDQNEGNEDQNQNEGDDNEDDNGKPQDEKSDNPQDQKGDKRKQPQPGKLSPQQVKNLLEAMNNQEKKVQEKINARKTKGAKVKTEKDW